MTSQARIFRAITKPNLLMLEILVRAGVNFNVHQEDYDDNSPLHLAILSKLSERYL